MIIAIDFDDTLTADPQLWFRFIEAAKVLEHRVICVTSRELTEDNSDTVDNWLYDQDIDIPVYFTSRSSKVDYMKKLGIKVDIWIDDDPRKCALGH